MNGIPEAAEALRDAILIAGPTASGKSALALDMARQHDAVIINADSMQVYDVLSVLTARPQADDLARAPHVLFGHVSPAASYSTGGWMRDVAEVIANQLDGRRAIFVGGTGLYFRALLGGLSDMPDVPEDVRVHFRMRLEREGSRDLHDVLARVDPVSAAAIRPGDGQRIVRALEVHAASGQPISHWQSRRGPALVEARSATRIVLDPDREWLRQRVAERFGDMTRGGGVEEVRALLRLNVDPSMPAMKAIGVPELTRWLAGEISAGEAESLAITATRQYAKRQSTWFRNQFGPEWQRTKVGLQAP